jgi:hypothetical protein
MRNESRFGVLILLIICWSFTANATIITVTTTNDSLSGSLRQAIIEADTSSHADTIRFNIPTSDPGYNADIGVWTIQPASEFDNMIGDSTFIDGKSQSTNQGDTNPQGPEIEIDGTNVEGSGIIIEGSSNKISGLIINRFSDYGVIIFSSEATGNIIAGNYIGTDATGEISLGNELGGILISGYAEGNIIGGLSPSERNIISGSSHSGNIYHGNGITIKGGHRNTIIGNYIGTNKDGTTPLPNVDYGICLTFAEENVIGGLEDGAANVVSGNFYGGIFIRFSETMNNTILGNFIGTDVTGRYNLGNFRKGIYLDWGTKNNVIGPQNVIRFNGNYGIIVKHDSTTGHRITQNSISDHGFGIFNDEGGNDSLSSPIIEEVTETYISGTACVDCMVEIFSDSSDEGAIYEGTVTADGSGNFSWIGVASGPNVTAVAIDTAGNTSQFSTPFVTIVEQFNHSQMPIRYRLYQNFPNPFNPKTAIGYWLSAVSDVELSVYNVIGQKVATLVSGRQAAGFYHVEWEANQMPSGVYYYRIKAWRI